MFTSRRRDLVFPQSEHARLAGVIALHWGNDEFESPALPFERFCHGVTLHDFGYGLLDTDDILTMSETRRRASFEALIDMALGDPVIEAVAKHHVLRLIRGAGMDDLEVRCRERLSPLIAAAGVGPAAFRRADTITRLCDTVAFDFCLDRAANGDVAVCTAPDRDHTRSIEYRVAEDGTIVLDPWPLCRTEVCGSILAYAADGYPERLLPTVIDYRLLDAIAFARSPERRYGSRGAAGRRHGAL